MVSKEMIDSALMEVRESLQSGDLISAMLLAEMCVAMLESLIKEEEKDVSSVPKD